MKQLIALMILFFIFTQESQAQLWADQFASQNFYGHKKLGLDAIKGSPYLDAQYKMGTVTSDDGVIYKDIPLRYNAYSDVLEFKKNDVSYDLVPKEKVKRAEFGSQIFSYRSYDQGEKGFFEIISEGKATLLARYKIKFYEEEPLKGYAEPKPSRFENDATTYWLSIKDGPAHMIGNNKKIIEQLGDKKNEIQSYISKEKLSTKKIEDLKKIITYYNSL